jgi:dihydroxyacetone kinase-like protein
MQRVLAERGVAVARTLVGNYVTSLDMAGASVTLCQIDEELLRLWDAPVKTPGLRWGM